MHKILQILILITGSESLSSVGMMKRIVVTGANKGIGYAVVERLIKEFPDTFVYLGSRDLSRGEKAVEEIIAKNPDAKDRIKTVELDVSDERSIQKAAEEIVADGKLYGLVNNAGIGWGNGFEKTIQTNFLGAVKMNEALLPHFHEKGRIVSLASAAGPNFVSACSVPEHCHILSKPDEHTIADIMALAESYSKMTDYENQAYGVSKALLAAYTFLFARQHEPNLIINCCTPGYILTDMTSSLGGATKTPDQGTEAICYLLMNPEVAAKPTGYFYGSDCKRSPLDVYRDPGSAEYNGPPF